MTALQRRSWLILALAAFGAACMFLGPDGWHGIDIGPVGATVFYGAMGWFVTHLARHPQAVFPDDAPPAERRAWVDGVFSCLIAIHFLVFVIALPELGPAADSIWNSASRRFSINLGMLIVGWIVVGSIVRAHAAQAVELDERDARILHGAQRAAGRFFTALTLALVAVLALFSEQADAWMRPLVVANVLLGLLIARALAENISIVARYQHARR
jgi:hypothetical protein